MGDRKWRESSLLVFTNKPIIARQTDRPTATTVVFVGTDTTRLTSVLLAPSAPNGIGLPPYLP